MLFPGVMNDIGRYEDGEMDEDEVVAFFQRLLDSGMIYHLQGSYQQTASRLMEAGLISPKR